MILVVLVFFAATLLLFLLPFLPGLREMRARRDATALPVSDAAVDVRHFAHGFRAFLERELAEPLQRVRASGMPRSGWIEQQGPYSVLAAGDALELFDDERARGALDRIVAATGDLAVPAGLACPREIYAGGSFRAGAEVRLRAVLAEEDVTLERGVRLLRWAHAGRDLTVEAGAVLLGRASAGRSIRVAPGCVFERMHAPLIRFGGGPVPSLPRAGDVVGVPSPGGALADWRPGGAAAPHELAAGRLLVDGDLEIPPRARVSCDLVVRGRLTIGAEARLEGSAKAHGAARLCSGVRVSGSVVGQGDVVLEDNVVVDGPVIAEERLTIGARCTIGTADEPSTVRAGAITVRGGSVVHGTAWASGRGEVTA